jgi:hypothetical protein
LIPVRFSTEEDALHGAAREIGKRCEPILGLIKGSQ